jgi:tetratricopeptide (TPR) repeat protein
MRRLPSLVRLLAVGAACAAAAGCGLPAAIGRGDAAVGRGAYDEADAAYVSAGARAPLDAWRGACHARLLAGKLAAALDACERALAANGADAATLTLKGRALRASARHDEAVRVLQAARAAAPDDRDAVAWLGMALVDDLRRGEAVATLRAWVDLRPDNPVRWAELASLQAYVYDLDDAERSWRKVIDLDPAGAAAGYAGLAEAFLLHDQPHEARRAAETALDRYSAQPYAGAVLARALAREGEKALARARLEASAPATSGAIFALLARAEVGRLLGDAAMARAALDAARARDATDERIAYERGLLLESLGPASAGDARAAYRAALAIRPFYLEARWRLALATETSGDPTAYRDRLLEFLAQARDVAALRPWVDDALRRLPPDSGAPGSAPTPAAPESVPTPG